MNKKILMLVELFVMFIIPAVLAVDLNQEISNEDKQAFDEILSPVMMIYNFIKYGATGIAGIMLLFSGINYMTSGSDVKKRDNAKHMATYVIIGLVVIWAAPFIVNLFVA